jgi:hypothetical protein
MKILLLLLLASGLFATVNEPLRAEVFSGYRNDRIHWHLQDPGEGGALTYSELYRDVEYWENGLVLKAIHRDLVFLLRGAYGTFGRGTLFQRYPLTDEHFRYSTEGWTADVLGHFGYAVNLTANRTYKVLFTPLIGYSAYFEQLKRSSLPGVFRLVWNGVFLGAGFTIQPVGRLVFNAGYSYHFMHNRVHTASVKTSTSGNKGHTGWAQMDWILDCLWRAGIGGQIHYFYSRVVDATTVLPDDDDISQKFKLRWTSVSGWAQISREF